MSMPSSDTGKPHKPFGNPARAGTQAMKASIRKPSIEVISRNTCRKASTAAFTGAVRQGASGEAHQERIAVRLQVGCTVSVRLL